ncbi:MAG: lytic transglycosylase domain-containing protein [Candidatus Acidiferrales bacterium]
MNRKSIIAAILTAGTWLSLSTPVLAQIASYTDEQGKLVFVNGDSPKARHGSTISSPRAAVQDVSATLPAGSSPGPLDQIVRDAAARHDVDPALVKAVISTESGWNPLAVSRKGAVGLMQLIPETAQRFGVGNPFDPVQNVEGGTMYLKSLLDRYNGDLKKSLAAYNAGERAVDQSGGVPAIPETQQYVQKVTDAYFRPGSGHNSSFGGSSRFPVRQEVDSNGRVVFTNE